MNKILFYDTCALLNLGKENLKTKDKTKINISSITLKELEDIKQNRNKTDDIRIKAGEISKFIRENPNKFNVVLYNNLMEVILDDKWLSYTPDLGIIASACYLFNQLENKDKECIFVTSDNNCANYAKKCFNLTVNFYEPKISKYTGYKEIKLNSIEMADFYQNIYGTNENSFYLLPNQYLLIKDENGQIVDHYLWDGNKYQEVIWQNIESKMMGDVRPKDAYQRIAFDSINRNQITVLRGRAGSGKSLIGLSYFFQELEKGNIDKILMFVNPVATKDSCKFGFLPGNLTEKILDSQIGNFLKTKIGDMSMVEKLVNDDKLMLIPVADCRGMDTGGLNAGVYITEAQNSTKDIMKLILQRIDDDTKVIIEGDDDAQVDMIAYGGSNNGLRKLSETFRGQKYYGEVTLQKCYRGKIADKAEEM